MNWEAFIENLTAGKIIPVIGNDLIRGLRCQAKFSKKDGPRMTRIITNWVYRRRRKQQP